MAEVLASVVIGSIVLVAMVQIHSQAERNAAAAFRRLDATRLPAEILQLIAEDLDRIVGSGTETRISINNKPIEGYASSQLTIRNTMTDEKNRVKEFETVIWQGSYDLESGYDGLVLYRGQKGIIPSDKLLDSQRESWESSYPFVPVCEGITYFTIMVPQGDQLLARWGGDKLPKSIIVTISFAEPVELEDGTVDVPEEEKFTRIIAIDRTRKINFSLIRERREDYDDDDEESDPNEVTDKDSDDKPSDDESDADDEPKEISGPDNDSKMPRKTK
ncbi:MAG: hypothetical protein ACYSWP_01355 [Planctomycetota bacterium]